MTPIQPFERSLSKKLWTDLAFVQVNHGHSKLLQITLMFLLNHSVIMTKVWQRHVLNKLVIQLQD